MNGVLVREGLWTAAAHEIGHTFWLQDEYSAERKPGSCSPVVAGTPASGYWIEGSQYVPDSVLDFMGTSPYHPSLGPPERWISRENWWTLLSQLDSQVPDPPLLVVGGIYRGNGILELQPWYSIPEGTADTPLAGAFKLRLLDQSGATLLSADFDMPLKAYAEPFGEMDTDVSGFGFSVAYPTKTAAVTIEDTNGVVILRVDPVGKLLQDAMKAIPASCFAGGLIGRHGALNDKAAAFAEALAAGVTDDALNKLRRDIRPHVNEWLISGCVRTSTLGNI